MLVKIDTYFNNPFWMLLINLNIKNLVLACDIIDGKLKFENYFKYAELIITWFDNAWTNGAHYFNITKMSIV